RCGSDVGLVQRLMHRHEHQVAWKIAEFLCLPRDASDRILIHWAGAKVRLALPSDDADSPTFLDVLSKLKSLSPSISYAEISGIAFRLGRVKLATRLLDYEPRAAELVP